MTVEEAYARGIERGREDVIQELMTLLGFQEYIAKEIASAMESHERMSHDID